jgi:hypothetical protein
MSCRMRWNLVAIDRERDRGTYSETNLWMRHG